MFSCPCHPESGAGGQAWVSHCPVTVPRAPGWPLSELSLQRFSLQRKNENRPPDALCLWLRF